MNFQESNEFVEKMEKKDKKKKTVMSSIIVCSILVVFLLIVVFYMQYEDSKKLKMYVNNQEVKISSSLLIEKNNQKYMNISEFAKISGYSYQKGEYKGYNEDEKSCYIRNNYEIVSMSADSTSITKYIINNTKPLDEEEKKNKGKEDQNEVKQFEAVVESENETQETFYITDTVIYENNALYVPFSELPRIFNVQLNTPQTNRIRIYTLSALIPNAPQIASKMGYTKLSDSYENLTAIIDNMLVVGDDNNNFGVVSLNDGQTIISLKYEKILYMQNTKEFLVTAEGSVGIISDKGETIIKPIQYDSISNLDELNKLYLVKKNNKYGVLDREGNIIVHPEYDSIGIENKEPFFNENIKNFSLLYGDCIPVNANGLVGLFDKEGNERLKCVYESLGYVASSSSQENKENKEDKENNTNSTNNTNNMTNTTNSTINSNAQIEGIESVLTIPESIGIKGIVVKLRGQYGIFDANVKRLIIPCNCSKIYARTKSGNTKYYLEYNEEEIDLEKYLDEYGLKTVDTNLSENPVTE